MQLLAVIPQWQEGKRPSQVISDNFPNASKGKKRGLIPKNLLSQKPGFDKKNDHIQDNVFYVET